jgi:predicted nucleic acid-binding protein
MPDTQKKPPLATLDGALDAFVARPETLEQTGRILTEAAATLVEAQCEAAEELLLTIDDSIAAAEALLDEADALLVEEEQQRLHSQESSKVDEVRAQLSELDDAPEE